MEPVYVGRTASGDFCSFTKIGDEVHIYLPSSYQGSRWATSFSGWLENAAKYSQPNDLALYDDVVNAAWQSMGYSNVLVKSEAVPLKTPLGEFYPRMWRGLYDPNQYFCYNPINARAVYGATYIRSNVAAASLFSYLQELFRYVEPTPENLKTFGNRLREILILTCTDVETSWRAVLEENTAARKASYSTKDYFKVCAPLRLSEWELMLRDYPDLGTFSPFKAWSDTDPTKSLPWYHAYNGVKHHREAEFASANLENLINALAAVHILQAAQWGPEIYDRMFGNEKSPFVTTEYPVYERCDLYVPMFDKDGTMTSAQFFDKTP